MALVPFLDHGNLSVVSTDQGFLRAKASLTRSGVFDYLNADGSKRSVYRPPSEVFDANSLSTLELAPFTNDHPPVFLDTENAKQYSVGTVGEKIERQGKWVKATVLVSDAETIAAIKGGKVETSLGYWCDYKDTPGVTPEGERYDGVQTNIRYNHASLVQKGRAGGSRLFTDSAETETLFVQEWDGDNTLKKIKLNGLTFEVEDQLAEALAADQKAANETLAVADAATEREKARADATVEKLDETKKVLDSALNEDEVQKRVDVRLCLERDAAKVVDSDEFKGKSDREIREAAILKACPKVTAEQLTDASDEYVKARFDHVMDSLEDETDDLDRVRGAATDGAPTGADAARTKYLEARRQANTDATPKREDFI